MIKKILNEFKTFAIRGNVIDMAVGIIIGAAFGKIVDSVVKDIMMPPLSLLLGQLNFDNLFFVLREGKQAGPYLTVEQAQAAGATILNLGNFINVTVSFVIVAFSVFLLVKGINTLRSEIEKKSEEEEVKKPTLKTCPYCFETDVPVLATRCPHCTSKLPQVKSTEEKSDSSEDKKPSLSGRSRGRKVQRAKTEKASEAAVRAQTKNRQ